MGRITLMVVSATLVACSAPPEPEPAEAKAEPVATPAAEVKAEPKPVAPAPEGTVTIDGRYVHTCAAPDSCPQRMQAEGAAHCEGLTLVGLKWRLPTIEELQSWRGNEALSGYDVFHWSGTVWDEDAGQVWIYDPGTDAKTTAKPTRKPFTIRCVAQPV